jgi:hypothetical protein
MHSAFSESMHEKILEFDHMHENKKNIFKMRDFFKFFGFFEISEKN